MMATIAQTQQTTPRKRLNVFERFLTLWVALCMIAGLAIGKWAPSIVEALRGMEFDKGSQVNAPIAILIWLMIIPMMMKVDFGAIRGVSRKPRGLAVTLFVNWLVKPFSMAVISWIFFRHIFSHWIAPAEADQYIAGTIILAAAPCTAMVFVWSYLTDGDPAYTLVQVSLNDLIMLFLFAPIVRFLVSGAASLSVPFKVLLYSVVTFIVIPLSAGVLARAWLTKRYGKKWFGDVLLPRFSPITILALLATLVLIFPFQADNITGRYLHVVLIAVPILIQVYFNATLAYGLMHLFKVQHSVAAPGALIGASNFFELAVATAIALFGAGSGAALATVVGVLVEVPVMLSVCGACNRTRRWFPADDVGKSLVTPQPHSQQRLGPRAFDP
jgi:arsenite transporter